MRLSDLYHRIDESAVTDLPLGTRHTLPRTVILPDTDLYYEYYRFVTAMACHPELDPSMTTDRNLRDVPIVVAYTPQEYDMIKAVAARMGKKVQEIAFNGSVEEPGGNTVSPVMRFSMSEAHLDVMKALTEHVMSDR
jgi:hypothetical protein